MGHESDYAVTSRPRTVRVRPVFHTDTSFADHGVNQSRGCPVTRSMSACSASFDGVGPPYSKVTVGGIDAKIDSVLP